VQWGSGVRFNIQDETIGWGPARAIVDFAALEGGDFRQVDVRLQKNLNDPAIGEIGLVLEVINLFDHANFRSYEQVSNFMGGGENARFSRPSFGSADPGLRLQFGLTLSR
jgi:hypothetical protein